MKILSYILGVILLSISTVAGVFAIEAPASLSINQDTDTSVIVSWEAIEEASGYELYYSTVSPVDVNDGLTQKRLFIPETSITVEGLESGQTYYFVVASFNEVGDGSELSSEFVYIPVSTNSEENNTVSEEEETTVDMNAAAEFKLNSVEVLAQNQVAVEFTAPLDSSAERVFKVVEKNDELLQYVVKDTKIDPNNSYRVLVTFDELLPVNTEFKLTVISILDTQGRNLESGIESFENFILEEDKLNYVYQEEIGGIVIINDDNTTTIVEIQGENNQENQDNSGLYNENTSTENSEEVINEESTVITGENQVENNENEGNEVANNTDSNANEVFVEEDSQLEGTNMSEEEVAIDLLSAGQEAETLPTTGPEHIFMLILALVFGAMSFVFKYRKS